MRFVIQVLFIFLAISPFALAANQSCTGTISHLWTDKSGYLYVYPSFRNAHVGICNVNSTVNSIAPSTCKSWQGLFQQAIASNKTITILYLNITTTCVGIATYFSAPSPEHVMLN